MGIAFYVALAAFGLALVSLAVSLANRRGSPAEMQSQLRALALDTSELYDKVEHWTRRERVRKLRDGQERAAAERAEVQPSPLMGKDQLRAMAVESGLIRRPRGT